MKPRVDAPAAADQIDGTADQIDGTADQIDGTADQIEGTAAGQIEGTADQVEGTAAGHPEPQLPEQRSAPARSADPGQVPEQRSAPNPAAAGLTERERGILAFEQRWWKHAGAKEQAIRDKFDLSATRYYQLLNGLLDNPAALVVEPVLVSRLRRLRATRARTRRR